MKELSQLGLELPLFVTCLFAGILVTNLLPKQFPRLSGRPWPSRTPSIYLIGDTALGTLLAAQAFNPGPARPVQDGRKPPPSRSRRVGHGDKRCDE